jgi:magnesium chelatase family protein
VPRVDYEKLTDDRLGEPSANIRARIEKARQVQRQRFEGAVGGADGNVPLLCNADMGPAEVREHCPLDAAGKSLLPAAMTQLCMSPSRLSEHPYAWLALSTPAHGPLS